MTEQNRMLGLDGLRGIAILVVIAFHESYGYFPDSGTYGAMKKIFSYGWLGVDLFFVLSGFLITGILLKALPAAHVDGSRSYFKTFYVRRAFRIFPIYYFFLLVSYRAFHYHPVELPWFLFHVSNVKPECCNFNYYTLDLPWYFFHLANLKPGFGAYDQGFVHLWSLSVEEQFYLCWPLLVLLAGPRRLAHICWSFIIGALALRCWMKFGIHFDPEGIHRLTPARVDTFAIGALVALHLKTHRDWIIQRRLWFWLASLALIITGIALITSPLASTLDWTFVAAGFGLLVAVVAAAGFRPMEWWPIRKIGLLSYSMYLFHQLVFMEAIEKLLYLGVPHVRTIGLILGAVLTIAFAELTGRLLEAPFNSMKDRFLYPTLRKREA